MHVRPEFGRRCGEVGTSRIDDDLKWKTNTECIVKNAAKRLHFLKILKGYNAPREDLKTFYFGNQINPGIWDQNLAWEFDRGTIQGHRDEQALIECGMKTVENRREKMWIKLINDMKDLIHKLNELLPPWSCAGERHET